MWKSTMKPLLNHHQAAAISQHDFISFALCSFSSTSDPNSNLSQDIFPFVNTPFFFFVNPNMYSLNGLHLFDLVITSLLITYAKCISPFLLVFRIVFAVNHVRCIKVVLPDWILFKNNSNFLMMVFT